MWESGDRFQGIKDAEVALLGSDVRRDSREVDRLLHSDFVEIGRSGRRWTRGEIVVALLAEEAREKPTTDEWLFSEIAPGLVLVTYRLRVGASRASRLLVGV
jgi:ribonuclease HI